MIIGTDLMSELGLKLNFQYACVEWEDASMPFKDRDATFETGFHVEYIGSAWESTDRIKRILDVTYEKADLEKITSECQNLNVEERESLLTLLTKYESLFDGTLGFRNHEEYDIEPQPGVKPYHARAYPIPKIHEQTLRTELERLCSIGVLQKVNRSDWVALTFIIPKKNGTVRFISDFRELNKRIKRKPFPCLLYTSDAADE